MKRAELRATQNQLANSRARNSPDRDALRETDSRQNYVEQAFIDVISGVQRVYAVGRSYFRKGNLIMGRVLQLVRMPHSGGHPGRIWFHT